jgi:tetratricopeptide (TPR) repeat protein
MSGSPTNAVQAGSISGPVIFNTVVAPAAAPWVVPAQVPPVRGPFIDRKSELALIRGLAADPQDRSNPALAVLRSKPGMGKTALMRKAAAATTDLFPDGTLHVDFGASHDSPSEAVQGLLLGLGVLEQRVPATFTQRVDQYRTHSFGRRLMVVFDNVTDVDLVAELLPNSSASLVLVAANRGHEDLIALGAADIHLTGLPVDDGVRLLGEFCDVAAEDLVAARELVTWYEGMPHAIRVAGARLRARRWPVARLLDELRDSADELTPVDVKVLAMFDSVYDDLPAVRRRVYRLLGVVVGEHFTVELLAAMAELPVREVQRELDELCVACLVEEAPAGTHRLHRTVRLHALQKSFAHDDDADRLGMLRRAVDWWLLGAVAADVAVTGRRRLRVADPDRVLGDNPVAPSRAAGMAWLDREQNNLFDVLRAAADKGWHADVCQLFEALFAFYDARRPLSSWVRAGELAVTSAELSGNAAAEARCRCLLAKAYQELERYELAHEQLDRARELAEGAERLLASTWDFTGNVCLRQDRFAEALGWFERALDINRRLGQVRGTAMQSMMVGRALGKLGRFDDALGQLASAREHAERPEAEAASMIPKILLSTGIVLADAGRHDEAERELLAAVDHAERLGNIAVAADALIELARQADRRQDAVAADRYRERAVALYERMGSPRATARALVAEAVTEAVA